MEKKYHVHPGGGGKIRPGGRTSVPGVSNGRAAVGFMRGDAAVPEAVAEMVTEAVAGVCREKGCDAGNPSEGLRARTKGSLLVI